MYLWGKIFEKVYTLTPALIKSKEGYWEDNISRDEYEERIKVNLIKKYNDFTGEKLDENFKLYKGKVFLGDKLSFIVSDNEIAQKLWYMSLGTGILENNSRGCGFVNYKYL